MADGILEVQLVNAKGLRDTDFFGTTCFCISIRIYFSVQSYVYDHVFSLSCFDLVVTFSLVLAVLIT